MAIPTSIEYPPSSEVFECEVPFAICGDAGDYLVSLLPSGGGAAISGTSATIGGGANSVAGSITVPDGTSGPLALEICPPGSMSGGAGCTTMEVVVDCDGGGPSPPLPPDKEKERVSSSPVRVTITIDCPNPGS